MTTTRRLVAAALVVAAPTLAACSDDDGGAALPDEVVCTSQYRPFAESMEGAEERTLTVPRVDATSAEGVGADFALMAIEVRYTGDAPEGRNVLVRVTDRDGGEIATTLYQIGRPGLGDIEFAGGHGFTGLHYVRHEPAMLQYFCGAGD